ncbi:lipopolysaccharide biosynthesis protein [Ferruginibacter albus]|uniref:lipopolysaccharide biosynthesis protein n=1 Tax=Ferruginibacter albus TaxID=2875540 RepID=UPI001CC36ED3|nr:oligosaccharide flippase family protein [Ferruginibacter albus]UAY52252.1 oligosaccharide flippase family protein [Ferruginibacter albus]
MDIFSRFKKDYLNYLLSIILPALITGAFIPILKRTLGAELYGQYAIFFYAALLCSSILSGWLVQSVLLFYNFYQDKELFVRNVFKFFWKSQLIILLPMIITVFIFTGSLIDSFLFFLITLVCSLQSVGLSIIQISKKSAKNIYSELIRSVLYLIAWLLFYFVLGINNLYVLYSCIIVSYTVSIAYIYKQINVPVFLQAKTEMGEQKELFKKFLDYGGPFSLWYIFSYLLSYIDKIFILKTFGAEMQGNYQAIFDMLSKTIVLALSPILTTLFPLLAEAYTLNQKETIKKTLYRIILLELILMVACCVCYWLFGATILFSILKIPSIILYKQMGLIVILGTFVFQIAMVAHKYFELKRMSKLLLSIVILAFVIQLVVYLLLGGAKTPLLYPAGYFVAASIYLLFVVYFIKRKINAFPEKHF